MNGFTILDTALQSADFEILICSKAVHDALWRERGSKANCDLWIIEQGSMRITYKKKTYTLVAGDVFFIEPDVAYSAVGGASGCAFYFTHFRARLEENQNVFSEFSVGGKTDAASVYAEVQSFKTAFAARADGAPMANFLLKTAIMQLCARVLALKDTKQAPLSKLEQLLKFMETHLVQPLSVSALAEKMNMSEKYFISYFKRHVGQTPHAYRIALKMQQAYAALYDGGVRVSAVAEKLGYCDAYAFSKAFKAYFGVSPSGINKNKGKTKNIFS